MQSRHHQNSKSVPVGWQLRLPDGRQTGGDRCGPGPLSGAYRYPERLGLIVPSVAGQGRPGWRFQLSQKGLVMAHDIVSPDASQRLAVESLYIHAKAVEHQGVAPAFGFHAQQCDAASVPGWVQNNAAAMAEDRQIDFKNGLDRIVDAAFRLDWRPHVNR